MNKIKSFFKLVRWTNLLIIAIMMCLVNYCLMSSLHLSEIVGVVPASPAFLLLVISLVFIVAGGYVINDYFDVEIDKINRPDKLIAGNVFTDKELKFFYKSLTFIGLLAGLASSVILMGVKFITLFAILLLLSCILYSYSSVYKKKFLIGNLIVSLSVAFAVFLPWLFEVFHLSNNALIFSVCKETMMNVLPFVLIYTAFAFLTTLIREIVKDAEDYNGDSVTRCRTIPVVCGMLKTRIIVGVLFFVLYVFLAYFHWVLLVMQADIAIYIMIVTETLCIMLMPILFKIKEFADFHRLSVVLKIIMVVGMLTMVFI